MFVSESKFLAAPHLFIPHIQNPNPEKLLALITKPEVEAALLVRLGNKARLYGQELDPLGHPVADDGKPHPGKLDPLIVVRLYEEFVIPLTKDVEVRDPFSPPSPPITCAVLTRGARTLVAGRLPAHAPQRRLGRAASVLARRRDGLDGDTRLPYVLLSLPSPIYMRARRQRVPRPDREWASRRRRRRRPQRRPFVLAALVGLSPGLSRRRTLCAFGPAALVLRRLSFASVRPQASSQRPDDAPAESPGRPPPSPPGPAALPSTGSPAPSPLAAHAA